MSLEEAEEQRKNSDRAVAEDREDWEAKDRDKTLRKETKKMKEEWRNYFSIDWIREKRSQIEPTGKLPLNFKFEKKYV